MRDNGLAEIDDGYVDRPLAEPGEPVFVLRGKDLLAPAAIEAWIAAAEAAHVNKAKIDGARVILAEMLAYPGRRFPT